MIHRAPFGSLERFVGLLIEHFAGAFPLWLAPVQATVIPIADRHLEYVEQVAADLRQYDIRVEVDSRRDRMQNKIRQAEHQRTPYILVMGDRDVQGGTVSVRERGVGDLGATERAAFVQQVRDERDRRVIK